jgi:hypothetical protein
MLLQNTFGKWPHQRLGNTDNIKINFKEIGTEDGSSTEEVQYYF